MGRGRQLRAGARDDLGARDDSHLAQLLVPARLGARAQAHGRACRQTLFTRNSILWWVLATYARRKLQYRERFDSRNGDGRSYIELRTSRETQRFVGKISRES